MAWSAGGRRGRGACCPQQAPNAQGVARHSSASFGHLSNRVTARASAHRTATSAPLSPSHYQTLGVPTTASASEVKHAFRRLAKTLHPDVNKNRADWAADQFKRCVLAYTVLSDPAARRQYDASRTTPPPQPHTNTTASAAEPAAMRTHSSSASADHHHAASSSRPMHGGAAASNPSRPGYGPSPSGRHYHSNKSKMSWSTALPPNQTEPRRAANAASSGVPPSSSAPRQPADSTSAQPQASSPRNSQAQAPGSPNLQSQQQQAAYQPQSQPAVSDRAAFVRSHYSWASTTAPSDYRQACYKSMYGHAPTPTSTTSSNGGQAKSGPSTFSSSPSPSPSSSSSSRGWQHSSVGYTAVGIGDTRAARGRVSGRGSGRSSPVRRRSCSRSRSPIRIRPPSPVVRRPRSSSSSGSSGGGAERGAAAGSRHMTITNVAFLLEACWAGGNAYEHIMLDHDEYDFYDLNNSTEAHGAAGLDSAGAAAPAAAAACMSHSGKGSSSSKGGFMAQVGAQESATIIMSPAGPASGSAAFRAFSGVSIKPLLATAGSDRQSPTSSSSLQVCNSSSSLELPPATAPSGGSMPSANTTAVAAAAAAAVAVAAAAAAGVAQQVATSFNEFPAAVAATVTTLLGPAIQAERRAAALTRATLASIAQAAVRAIMGTAAQKKHSERQQQEQVVMSRPAAQCNSAPAAVTAPAAVVTAQAGEATAVVTPHSSRSSSRSSGSSSEAEPKAAAAAGAVAVTAGAPMPWPRYKPAPTPAAPTKPVSMRVVVRPAAVPHAAAVRAGRKMTVPPATGETATSSAPAAMVPQAVAPRQSAASVAMAAAAAKSNPSSPAAASAALHQTVTRAATAASGSGRNASFVNISIKMC